MFYMGDLEDPGIESLEAHNRGLATTDASQIK